MSKAKRIKGGVEPPFPCPQCHGNQWEKTSTTITYDHSRCATCGYQPRHPAPTLTGVEFDTWEEQIYTAYEQAGATLQAMRDSKVATEKEGKRLPIRLAADLRKAQDDFDITKGQADIASLLGTIKARHPEGHITIHLPDLGLITQFVWGDYLAGLAAGLEQLVTPTA